MNCYKRDILIILITLSLNVSADSMYPNLREVMVGEKFSHPNANQNPDTRRPTTQYKVPNYGEESEIFPEYELVILNSNDHVVIVTAEAVMQSLELCKMQLENFHNLVKLRFKTFIKVQDDNPNFFGIGSTYHRNDSNEYYSLDCKRSYGPFWSLSYQIRGQIEDKTLRSAWEEFNN